MNTILITLGISFAIAFILGILLGFFKKVFHVPVDPKIEAIRSVLPGANCGACGFPGCDGFAAAVAEGTAPVDGCAAGGKDTAEAVGKIMGVSASAVPQVILLACQGSKEHAQNRGIYNGVKTCLAAKTTVNGTKLCSYGCIGFGDCVAACQFDADAACVPKYVPRNFFPKFPQTEKVPWPFVPTEPPTKRPLSKTAKWVV